MLKSREHRDVAARSPLFSDVRGYGVRVGLFYAALFLLYGVQIPFMPVWLDWRGLSASEIALVGAAPFFLRVIISPGLAIIADRTGQARTIILALALCVVGLAIVLNFLVDHTLIALGAILLAISMISMMPLTETIAVQGVTSAGLDYGRMRLWGSLSFIAIGYVAGVAITANTAGMIIWFTLIACVATLLCSFLLPRVITSPHANKDTSPERQPSIAATLKGAQALIREPLFVCFLVAGGLVQAAHATFYTFGALLWQAQGISATWIAVLWAIGVVTEIIIFAYSERCLALLGAIGLMLVGAVAAVVRWTIMSFDPSLEALVPLQVLHGFTYGASHLGAIHFMRQAVGQNVMATAQALYGSVAAGIAMGFAMLLAAPLYETYAGASYLAMTALSVVGLLATVWVGLRWDGNILNRNKND